MKKHLKGIVLNIENIAKDTVRLEFSTPLESILPGQFVAILIPHKTLRRPFSVADFCLNSAFGTNNRNFDSILEENAKNKGAITVLFKLKGDGTNYLKGLQKGDMIDYLAPLGNTFTIPDNKNNPKNTASASGDITIKTTDARGCETVDRINQTVMNGTKGMDKDSEPSGAIETKAVACAIGVNSSKKALLIGAGIGIAPMLYLKKILDKKSISNYLISGFKTEEEVIKGSDGVVIGGSVIDKVQNLIDEFRPEILYSCGPKVVLQMVCDIAKKNELRAEIAMEKVMACGIGVCRGCVIKLEKDDAIKNASVCADGPVFSGAEVIWE